MSMFEELFALARSATLTMTLSADAATGQMTINVVPRPREDAPDPALAQALSLTATPHEFDAGFVAALRNYRTVRQSLAQQAEATQAVIEAARAASAQKASGTHRKPVRNCQPPAQPTASAVPVPVPALGVVDDDEAAADPLDATQEGEPAPACTAPAPLTGASFDLFG